MLTFRRLGNSTLYLGESTDSSDSHGQLFFILPRQTSLPGSSLTFDEAWSFQNPSLGAGYFLFLQSHPALNTGNQGEVEAFANRIHELLPRVVRNQHASLAWATGDPTNPSSVQIQTLNVIRDADTGAIQTQNIPQAVRFQQIEVMILPATPVERLPNDEGLVLRNTDYTPPPGSDPRVGQPTQKRVYMRGAAAYNIDKVGDSVRMPFEGAGRGSLQFDVNGLVAADIEPGVLDVAMYYVVPEPTLGRDQSLRYPLLNLRNPGGIASASTAINVHARLYPADHGASILELGSDNNAEGPVLQSYFGTYHGYPVHLVPLAGAGLKFTHVPNPGVFHSRSAEVATHYGLIPVGYFELLVDNPSGEMEWLRGGSSGSEFVSFQPRTNGTRGDVIAFFPGQNAYAPDFATMISANPTRRLQQGNGPLLTNKYTTSWVSVGHHPLIGQNGHRNQYYAQPDDNVLHTSVQSNPYLNPFEVPAADLPHLTFVPSDDEWASFPMTPLNGVYAPDGRVSPPIGMEEFVIFEKEIMSPTRKERITSAKVTAHATSNGRSLFQDSTVHAVTPQGMLVTVDGTDWQTLTLAYDDENYLRFNDITDEFQDALQSNRLFLVASKSGSMAIDPADTEDTVEITGWPFRVEVGQDPHGVTPPTDLPLHRHNNVVVYKFVDETFEDLIADTRIWANPDFFNEDLADVQAWLQEVIDDAKAKAEDPETEDLYGPLVNNVLTNPNWTGVLAFNVTVPADEMPCEVQGLMAGIRKLAEFKAHHIGFEISKVNDLGTDIEKSSIFALIDYEDNDGPAIADPPLTYEFVVKALKVRFANTEIADFASTISIKMKEAFDEKIKDPIVNQEKVTIDTLELEGSYQNFNGTPSYTFELVAVNNPFEFGSTEGSMSLIHQMTVTKVQFVTETCVDDTSAPDAKVTAKFLYWGYLNFRSSAVFDFFSFDKLVFSGLVLRMSFGFNDDGTPEPPAIQPTWEFDPSNLNISVKASQARKDSLLANFPLRLNSFHYAPGGIDISNLGYLEIPNLVPGWGAVTTDENGDPVTYKPRYALSFTIDLGPLSSMTSKKVPTGAIEIISAWFTESEGSGALFGLKLGAGSDGTKEFGLQGVLTLSVDHFGFLKIPENPGPNEDWMYAFFIKSAFLKIVNTQIPPGGDFSLMLFVPYSGETGEVNLDNLGWFVAYNNTGGSNPGGGGGAPHPVDASIDSVSVTPSTFDAGGSTTIRVEVSNSGNAIMPLEITVSVQVKATGDTTHRPLPPTPPNRKVKLGPGQSSDPLEFNWPGKLPGTYEAIVTATVAGDLSPGNNTSSPQAITVRETGSKKEKRSIVKLDYLGLGHRIEMATVDQEWRNVNTVEAAIDIMRTGLLPSQSGPALQEQLQKIYDPDGGLLLGVDVTLFEIIRIAFIFAQSNEIYGGLIGFTQKAPAKLRGFQVQVLYKKITDEIGVYQILLKLPDFLRQFELGAASITLPLIGIDIYTNGDFKLDFGFPYNLDWSRAANIQMMAGPIPIIGYIGFYFAKLSGATSTTAPALVDGTPDRWDPVLEFGVGLSLGIGKHIEKGPLRAGVSISIEVVLEGALAWYQDADGEASNIGDAPDWYRIKGIAGLVAQLYGILDFGIVKVGLEVNASARFMFVYESYKDIAMGVTMSVSVRITIVIGSFKIFGKTVRISVSFSFSAQFSFQFTVKNPQGTNPPAHWQLLNRPSSSALAASHAALQQVVEPIAWDALDVHGGAKKDLRLTFVPQVTIAHDGERQRAHAVASLTIGSGNDSDFNELLRAVMSWAVRLHTTSSDLTLADLEALHDRLQIPRTLATSQGNSDKPLNYTQIRDFLTTNFNPLIVRPLAIDPTDPAPAEATVFPIVPELTLEVEGQQDGFTPIDFAHYNARNEQYQLAVADYFDELLVDVEYKSGIFVENRSLLDHDPATEVSMATIVLQDYFAFLVKTGVDRAVEYARTNLNGGSIGLDALLDALEDDGDFTTVSRMAARFFFHGLRLPPEFNSNDNVELSESALPLYELTGQQVPIRLIEAVEGDGEDDPGEPAQPWVIELKANSGSDDLLDLGTDPVSLTIPAENDEDNSRGNVAILETLTPAIGESIVVNQLANLTSVPREFSFRNPTHFELPLGSRAGSLYPLPELLLDRLTSRGSLNVAVHNDGTGEDDTPATPIADANTSWALRINFTARRVQRTIDGTGALLDNIYVIAGTTEGSRNLIGRVLDDASLNVTGLRLFYEIEGKTDAIVADSFGSGAGALLLKTNLSTISAPQADIGLMSHDPEGSDYSAEMDAEHAREFLSLIWEASITNAPGYFLYYHNGSDGNESGLPEDAFHGGANNANLSLLVTFDSLNDACNTLVIGNGSFVQGDLYATAEHELVWHPAIAPGAVAFELVRQNPQAADFTGANADIALEPIFNLLSYYVDGDGISYRESIKGLPVGPTSDDLNEPEVPAYWTYRQGIKVAPFALQNQGTFDLRPNLYAGTGLPITLGFEFLDIFGNEMPGNALASHQFDVYYTDAIKGVGQWPSLTSGFTFDPSGADAQLTVTLEFAAGDYKTEAGDSTETVEAKQRRVASALETYLQIKEQLHGPHVIARLTTSIAPDAGKYADVLPALRGFVDDIITFLEDPESGSAPADMPLTMNISGSDRAAQQENIFAVTVHLTIERTEGVDPLALEIGPNGQPNKPEVAKMVTSVVPESTSGIVPENGANQEMALTAFAEAFESAFTDLKVATGMGEDGPQTIWAVRMPHSGITVSTPTNPVFFAPAPLSNVLEQRDDVTLRLEGPSGPVTTVNLAGIDMDLWGREFLAAVDRFLSADLAVTARQISPENYVSVIKAKESLAEGIAAGVTNVLEHGLSEPEFDAYAEEAREAYRQSLLTRLSTAYEIETAVVHTVSTSNSNQSDPNPPRLFGRVSGSLVRSADAETSPGFSFSNAKIDLDNSTGPKFAYLFSAERAQEHASAYVNVRYHVTHVEHDIQPENEDGYQASSWLTLLLPDEPIEIGATDIPIALREYPTPPTLAGQKALPDDPESEITLQNATQWQYHYTYQQQAVAQDSIFANIKFNVGREVPNRALLQDQADLFVWLARFDAEYPRLLPDLDLLVKGDKALAGSERSAALDAMAWFTDLVTGVASVWQQWVEEQAANRALQQALEEYTWEFEVIERHDPGQGRIEMVRTANGRPDARFPSINLTLEDGETRTVLAPIESDGVGRYLYVWNADALPETRERTLIFNDLDVLSTENAWGGINLQRNLNLSHSAENPPTTNPRFVYQTPQVRFVNKVTPLIDNKQAIDISGGQKKSLSDHIGAMMSELFRSAVNQNDARDRLVKVGVRYAYDVRGQSGPAIGPGQIDEFQAYVPVTQVMPFFLKPNNMGQFISDLTNAINSWKQTVQPIEARGFYEFDLSVFAALSDTDLPVVRLRRLWLGLDRIV